MSRLIATFVIGKLDWAEPMIPFMRAYASRTGADFLEVKWFPEQGIDYPNKATWVVVEFLKDFIRQDRYDEVLLLDADVLVLPSCPNLFEKPGDLLCAPDQAWPVRDERFWQWLDRHFPGNPFHGVSGPYFNSGVLLIRKEAALWLNLEGPYPVDHPTDQNFLNLRSLEARLDVRWLGYEFNQRDFSDPQKAIRENHILHFVGKAKDRIPDILPLL